jgi:3'-5' exoribonuclease
MPIRDFEEGQIVEQALLVRDSEVKQTRNGDDYLRLVLADRTGSLPAVAWEVTRDQIALAEGGAVVFVSGRYGVHERYGPQLRIAGLRAAEAHEYELDELLDGPGRSAEQMEADLRELLATIQNPHLRRLLDEVFGPDAELWALYRIAPAAKYYHQAYIHGLLEHSLSVAQSVSAISATFPGIDRDVAVTGALIHDIGKLEAYTTDPGAIDLTDAGRLEGEIPLGYYRIRRLIEDLPGFPPALAQAVLHIILSHHGALEHGSPVLPATREATLVHMIDNLGGRLGSFDRLEKSLPSGAQWSSFDRALGGSAYFAAREEAPSAEAA